MNVLVVPPVRLFTFIQLADTLAFFLLFFFEINFLFYKPIGWIMILCVPLCITLVMVMVMFGSLHSFS